MSDVITRLILQEDMSGKFSKISSAAKSTTAQLKDLGNQINKAFVTDSPETFARKLGNAVNDASDDVENFGKMIDEASKGFDSFSAAGLDEMEKAFSYTASSAKAYRYEVEEAGKNSGMDSFSSDVNEAGNALDLASSKAFNLGNAIKVVAGIIGTASIAGAVKDFARDSVDLGKNYTSMMSEVQAISGASASEIAQLEQTAREYGATTVFSATEAAEALKYMSLAGWDASQSSSALGGVLDLAAASGMGLGQASDMVTDYLSAFGMEANQSAYFADMLAYAQSNSNTTAEQLGEAYRNSAANLNAAGQDVETVTSMLEAMANQGYKGSEAGTALTAVMRDITNNMENGSIKIGDTSVAVSDVQGNFRDLTDILLDVEKATNGMGEAERAAALGATFTADSTKGLNLMLNEGIENIAGYEKALRSSTGAASDMADTMNDNLAGDMANMNSAFEEMQLQVFESMENPLREGVQYLTSDVILVLTEWVPDAFGAAISGVAKFGNALRPVFETVLRNPKGVTTALAGIGTGILAFKSASSVPGIIDGLTGSIGKLGSMITAHPYAAAAAGIAAAVVAIKGAVDEYNEIRVEESLSEHFGDIELSEPDIEDMAGKIIGVDWLANINLSLGEFENAEEFHQEAEEALLANNKLLWEAGVQTRLKEQEDPVSPFISAIQDLLDGKQDSSGLEFLANVDTTVSPNGSDNTALVQSLVDFANEAIAGAEDQPLEEYAKEVAMKIAPEGVGDNTALVQSLVEFANGVVRGAEGEDLDPYLDNVLVNLTPEEGDSFMLALAQLTGDLTSQKLEPRPSYEDTLIIKLTPEMQEDFKSNIESYLTSKAEELNSLTYASVKSMETILGDKAGAAFITQAQSWAANDTADMSALSSSLTTLVEEALQDGVLDVEEQAAIDILQNKINNIVSGWKEAQADAEWQTLEMKWSGKDLTSESFTSLLAEARDQRQTAIEALDADTTEMNAVFNGWENSNKISGSQREQLGDLWKLNYKNTEGEAIGRELTFAFGSLKDTYGDLINENLERIATMGGSDTINSLNDAAEQGMWGTMLGDFKSNRDFYSENGGSDHDALSQMYDSMKPNVSDIASLIDSYRKDGMEIPKAIMDSYNDAIKIGAAAGDSDAAWQMYANTMLENGNEQLVSALTDESNPMYETIRNQMPEELANAVDRAVYAAEKTTESGELSELFNSILGLDDPNAEIDLGKLSELCEKYGLDISEYLAEKGIEVDGSGAKIKIEDFDPTEAAQYACLTATGNAITLEGGEIALEYEVNTGDTLSGIAEKTGVALDELKEANQHIFDERGTWDLILEGDLLFVPQVEANTDSVAADAGHAAEEARKEAQAAADASTKEPIDITQEVDSTYVKGEEDRSALEEPNTVENADPVEQQIPTSIVFEVASLDDSELAAAISEKLEQGDAVPITVSAAVTVSAGEVFTSEAVTAAATQTQDDLISVFESVFDASGNVDVTLTEENNVQEIYSEVGNAVKGAFAQGYSATANVDVTLHANYSLANPTKTISFGGGATGEAVVSAALHAEGGYFDTPHLGMVAEAGVGEYIIPMDGSERSIGMWQDAGQMLGIDMEPERSIGPVNTVQTEGMPTGVVSGEKNINLNINGSGKIQVGGGSKEDVLRIVMENIKEIVMGLLQDDILTEGNGTYEY